MTSETPKTDRQALQAIIQVLGPEPVCLCAGCAWETGEALRIIRAQGIEYIDRKKARCVSHDQAVERRGNEIVS